MQTDVKTRNFLSLVDANANQDVGYFERDERSHDTESDSDKATDSLISELHCVPIDQAERSGLSSGVFQAIVDKVGREDTREERTKRSADSVNSKSVERVVVPEYAFDFDDHP